MFYFLRKSNQNEDVS